MICKNVVNMDAIWMIYAVVLTYFAETSGEIPIGAVLILNGKLIGYGWNSSRLYKDPSAHAEIIALRMGGIYLDNYRLLKTTLYVTLEPCVMCIGAVLHARVYRLVCGAKDKKIGCVDLWLKYTQNNPVINHKILINTGILETVCSTRIKKFFKFKRKLK